MKQKNLSFPKALEYIADLLGYKKSELISTIKSPFGGFYKKFIREIQEPETSMKTYDEEILEEYENKFNTMFFKDGINYITQKKYNVGFDLLSNRITIPEYTFDGKLCGIMGRSIDSECEKEERWLPIIPCSRSLTLYGYHTNYEYIQNKNLCVIGESEKFPQQLDSFGCYIGLASCGCHLSDIQVKYLKGLLISKIILAYDEGLEEEYIREEAKKLLINNQIFNNNVGYVWDKDNVIIPKDSKGSPSDYGKDKFSYLMKHCVKWLGR
jgi:DNA primase